MSKPAQTAAPRPEQGTPAFNSMAKAAVLLLTSAHLFIAAYLTLNWLTQPVIPGSAEAVHAQFGYQAGSGARLYGGFDVHTQEVWYTPLVFQLGGLVSRFFDYDIRAMRVVTALGGWGSLCLMGLIVFRLTGRRWLAWAAAGILAGSDAGPWYVEFVPNSVHIAFTLLGLYLLLRDPSLRWATVVGVTLALYCSFWSKQTGAVYLAAGVFSILVKDWKKGLAAGLLAGVLVIGSILYYELQPDASFMAMTMMHRHHPVVWQWLLSPVLFPELLGRFGIVFALAVPLMLANGFYISKWLHPLYIFFGAAFVVGAIMRLKYGSGPTASLGLYATTIACAMLMLHRLIEQRRIAPALALALVGVQAVALARDFTPAVITDVDRRRFSEIVEILKTPGKTVYYNNQGFLNVYAGKPAYASVGRECWKDGRVDRSLYPAFYRDYFSKDPFDLVIIDVPLEDNSWFLYERLNANYQPVREIPPDPRGNISTLCFKKIVFVRKDQVKRTGPS